MANWGPGANQLDISQTGDGKRTGFTKVKKSIADLYDKLNALRTLRSSNGEPEDIIEKEIWYNDADSGLYRRGMSSSELASLKLGDIITKGPDVDVRAFIQIPEIGVTDLAIQRAIDSVKSSTTGGATENVTGIEGTTRIIVPAGRVKVYSTIKITTYIHLVGNGKHNTIFDSYITDGSPIIELEGTNDARCFYNSLADFSIDGRNQNCVGIKFTKAHRWTVYNVFVGETGQEGLLIDESYLGDFFGVMVRECGSQLVPAVRLTGPSQNYGSHAIHFFGGEIINMFGDGIYFEYGLSSGLFGTTIENCGGRGVVMSPYANSTHLVGCYFEDNHINVWLEGLSQKVNDNYFSTVASKIIAGVTGSITVGTNTLVLNNIANIAVGDYISIAGVSGIKVITDINGLNVTIHSNADATVTDAAISGSNPCIVIHNAVTPNITGNFMPDVVTDIMPKDSTSFVTNPLILGNHPFGLKAAITVDPQLVATIKLDYGGYSIGNFNQKYNISTGEYELLRSGVKYQGVSGVGNRFYKDVRVESGNKLYLNDKSRSVASAAPTSGTWAAGDIVFNSSPAAGGYIGWVCTVAGSPGTWKGFGGIQA